MSSGTQQHKWVDATGCLRWGPQNPTGVPRVEMKIVAAAMAAPDFKLAYLDRTLGVYRPCSAEDLRHIEELVDTFDSAESVANLSFYWRNRASIIKHFEAETGRNLAALLIGNKTRRGPAYVLVKAAIRAFVSTVRLVYRVSGRLVYAGKVSGALEPNSEILVSHIVDRRDVCARAIARQQLKTSYLVHDIIPLMQPAASSARMVSGFNRWLRRAAKENAKLICVSQGTADDLKRWFREAVGIDYSDSISACPLTGVGLPLEGMTQPIDAAIGKRFVLYVSTFNPRKKHDFLVEVWERLINELGAELTPSLVLVGRDEPYKSYKSALAAHPSAAAKIINLGSVSNETLRWAYENCIFAVFPSEAEGWGLGLTEALRFGKPVVHTDTPQLNEAARGLMPALPCGDHDAWHDRLTAWITADEAIRPYEEVARTFEEIPRAAFESCVLEVLRAR